MRSDSQQPGGVLVCQRGARRRYAVPRLLEKAGLLKALYTDSCAYSPAGRIAGWVKNVGVAPMVFRSLAARIPAGIPPSKVFSSDRLLWPLRSGESSHDLSPVYRKWGLQGAIVVYSMYGEDIAFLEWAKDQGAKLIVDVFIHPGSNRIIAEETRLFNPEAVRDTTAIDAEDQYSLRVFGLADLLLCPSDWVADGVREFAPECAGKVRVVPYGSSVRHVSAINEKTEPGRILFAGREPMRKGLHYLAEAAAKLQQAGLPIEVRAAGVAESALAWMAHAQQVRCLGTLPMDRMREEYENADLFVFPSLSEGQAGVMLEAMACGCPVIATRESGVDLEPGGGVCVPVGNADALAEAIAKVVNDRSRRNELAREALHRSKEFTMEVWQERLVHAVMEVETM